MSVLGGSGTHNYLYELCLNYNAVDFVNEEILALTLGKRIYRTQHNIDIESEFQYVYHHGRDATSAGEASGNPGYDWAPGKFHKEPDRETFEEFVGVIIFRWTLFPWDRYLDTSFAFGEGLSYALAYPPLETNGHYVHHGGENNVSKLLNYLLFEFTFEVPDQPFWDIVFRIHHRSGIYGLVGDIKTGSNFMCVGLRYNFK